MLVLKCMSEFSEQRNVSVNRCTRIFKTVAIHVKRPVNERKSRKGDAIQVQNMEKEEAAAAAMQVEKRMKTSALVFDQRQNIRKKHTNTHFFRLLSQSMHAQFYSLSRSSRVA